MATYKEIKGVTVQTRDEDPVIGGVAGGSWSSGGSLNTGRRDAGGAGTQTAAQSFFGLNPAPTALALNEYYDGSSWSEQADGNTARGYGGGIGQTQTASLLAGGFASTSRNETEVWNGSSWTEVNNINTARENLCNSTAGSSTSGLIFGGYAGGAVAITEEWDGTNWTESGDLNSAKYEVAGTGTQTAAISAGGNPRQTNVEQYNGSSWTEITDVNTARTGSSAAGLYTDTLVFGGNVAPGGTNTAKTEFWNGTSWTELNDLSAAKTLGNTGMGTTTSSSLYFAGISPAPAIVGTTEEWALAPPTAAILTEGSIFLSGGTTLKGFGKAAGIPAATFASGGSLNTARGYHGGAGTDHEALLAFGGTTGTAVNNVEQYNGSRWSEVAEINTTRANVTGFGSSTAAIAGNGSTPDKSQVESWNGSAWTEIAELNTSRSDSASAGIQTSGMVATGTPVPGNPALQPGGTSTVTETWNGTSWTEVGDTNTKRLQAGMAVSGTTSAGIIAAGEDGPGSRTVNAETWNGTSWTEVSNISQQRGTIYNFMGHSTSANMAGGYSGTARVANNEHWNGSSWTEINDLSTARNAAFGAGSAVNGAVFGGDTGDYQSATEEFIADNALSTVTVS